MKPKRPILIGGLFLASTIALVLLLEPEASLAKQIEKKHQPVTIVNAHTKRYQPHVTLIGTTSARWQSELKAQSSAELIWLDDRLEPGVLVKKGALLAKLDKTALLAERDQALTAIKQAKLQLQKEQHEQTVALKMLRSKSSSSYARREPQIAAAKATLTQAKSAYLNTQKRLDETLVRAPFDAVILKRAINPGQYVEQAQPLFEIAASDSLDVVVPIGEQQWKVISEAFNKPHILVRDRQNQSWPATIRYVSPKADMTTRQRQVVLAVSKPYETTTRLLPNQQVNVEVSLSPTTNSIKIPASSLTRDGQIWIVNNRNQLTTESVTVLQQGDDELWVQIAETGNQVQASIQGESVHKIVVYPLLSMQQGLDVTPIEENYK